MSVLWPRRILLLWSDREPVRWFRSLHAIRDPVRRSASTANDSLGELAYALCPSAPETAGTTQQQHGCALPSPHRRTCRTVERGARTRLRDIDAAAGRHTSKPAGQSAVATGNALRKLAHALCRPSSPARRASRQPSRAVQKTIQCLTPLRTRIQPPSIPPTP